MSSIQDICDAIAWTVYTDAPIGAALGPRTTIDPAHPASIGDDHVTLIPLLAPDTRSRITEGGVLTFRDNRGEEELPIASVTDDGVTVKLDFSGLAYSGLQHAHAGNAKVSSNVFGWAPTDIASMLDMGDSVFMAAPLRKGTPISGFQFGLPTYHIEIQCIRKLYRTGPQTMNPNMWAKRTQQGGWTDLDAIEKALLGNTKLNTEYGGPFASKLGQQGSSADVINWDLTKYAVDKDTWVYFYSADLTVTGIPEPIG